MAMGFGGIGMLSGVPMFQGQMGGGMFAGQRPMFPGASGGFVGGMNPTAQSSADDYYERTRQLFADQAAQNAARRAMRDAAKNTDREMSLKEMLANHQMAQDQAATGLARDRLGLDWNTASADANQRANALGLQERLGWAGENRMSAADQMQHERANQQLSLQERLGLMSENRLSQGQNQDEAFRRAQLGQQAELARLPYQMQDANSRAQSDFQNRQLGQQDKQFNRQFTDMPLADRWRTALAEKQQQLDQSNTDRAFNDLSARDRQTGQLEEKRMGMTERLAGNENQLRRDLQRETLAQQLQMWSGLSAAEKQQNEQFGRNLAQQLWEFKNVSGNNRFTTDAQKEMQQRTLDQNQLHEENRLNLVPRTLDAQLKAEAERDKARNEVTRYGITAGLLNQSSLPMDEDMQSHLLRAVGKEFGVPNSPIANPQERTTRTMLDNLRSAAETSILGENNKPKTPAELQRVNAETARMLTEARRMGFFQDTTTDQWLNRTDRNRVQGSKTVGDMLQEMTDNRRRLNARPASPIGVAPADSPYRGRFGGY